MGAAADFAAGVRAFAPALLAIAPYGAACGVLTVQSGFSAELATLLSAAAFSASGQLAALEVFARPLDILAAAAAVIAVNARFALYSAASRTDLLTHPPVWRVINVAMINDMVWAQSVHMAAAGRPASGAWLAGANIALYVIWALSTLFGAMLGDRLPPAETLGADFFLPALFLAFVLGMARRRADLAPAMVGIAAAGVAVVLGAETWTLLMAGLAGGTAGALFTSQTKAAAP